MPSSGGKIACIGVGTVGRAWAIVFARAGHEVALYDSADGAVETALDLVARNARDFEAAGLIDSASEMMSRIHPARSLEAAAADAHHVQESVKEEIAVKQSVFAALSDAAPAAATLASSSSAIPASHFVEAIAARDRCLIAHPVNPPSLIPLVELCASSWTAPETVERVRDLMRDVGQHPIVLKREIPGFILNRLQYTLVGEALHLVGEGYCEAEDIDAVLKYGLALRWVLMGPFEVAHLNATQGFKGFVDHLEDMMRTVGREARPDYPWTDALIQSIHDGLCKTMPEAEIGDRQVTRDKRLMSLLSYLKERDSAVS